MKKNDTAIVITTYCAEPRKDVKLHMTKKLAQSMMNTDHIVVIASHSPLPVDVQQQCDLYVYDNDNLPHVNGIPEKATKPFPKWDPEIGVLNAYYGIAELKSMHNAINALQKYPHIKNILKLCYDSAPHPHTNYIKLIERAKLTKKKLCTPKLREQFDWDWVREKKGIAPKGSLGTHAFFTDIEFFRQTLSLDEVYRYDTAVVPWLECVWYDSIKDKKLLDDVHIAESFWNFMGETIKQYNDSANLDGPISYPF